MPKTTPPIPRKVILVTDTGRLWRGDSIRGVYERDTKLDDDLMTDPLRLLEWCAMQFRAAGEGNLVVDRPPLHVWDDGDLARQLREFTDWVKVGGWQAGAGAELGNGWITYTNEGQPAVHMAIRRMMPEDRMLLPDLDPEYAVERLCEYAKLIGANYRATPGVSALAALRNVYDKPRMLGRPGQPRRAGKRLQPRWVWNKPAHSLVGCGDMHYQRRPLAVETRDFTHVIAFDMRAAYLAAAAGMKLAWHAPTHTGAIMWDPGTAGFFRIDTNGAWWAQPGAAGTLPIVNPLRVESDGSTWVTHPILAYLSEIGEPMPAILDSYTAMARDWVLREWAEQIRDALPDWRTAGDEGLRALVKGTYQEAFGMMGRAGGRVYRDDWHHAVVDETRVRLIRKIEKARLGGLLLNPLKIKVDCVWYPNVLPTDVMLSLLGSDANNAPHIGQFKVDKKNTGTMAAFLDKYRLTPREEK